MWMLHRQETASVQACSQTDLTFAMDRKAGAALEFSFGSKAHTTLKSALGRKQTLALSDHGLLATRRMERRHPRGSSVMFEELLLDRCCDVQQEERDSCKNQNDVEVA